MRSLHLFTHLSDLFEMLEGEMTFPKLAAGGGVEGTTMNQVALDE